VSTIYYTGNAHATKQIDLLPVTGTWAAGDTVRLTIGNKDLIITVVDGTTTAQVAQSIQAAWNAGSRLDGTTLGVNTNTSNFGGQEHGEFAEAEAVIYPAETSTVRIIGRKAGRPFTLVSVETTAGDGDISESTEQAATGPNHWNNADNWSGIAVPANDDIVVFKDLNVSVLYGLPNASLEVTIQQYSSYTGDIGLAAINTDNGGARAYTEYRQRYVRLDDAGTGTDIAHRFGIGAGPGSSLINVRHATVKISPVVYNTGQPRISGQKALNIAGTATTSTINILNGSVDFSSQDSVTSAFVTVKQSGGDSKSDGGIHTTGAVVTIAGGRSTIGNGAIATIHVRGGALRLEGQTGTITALNVLSPGIVEYPSTATITTLTVKEGTFDARADAGPFTITNTNLYLGNFWDPFDRVTATNPINVFGELSPQFLLGGSNNNAITVTPPA
jgi:hypothetical protein